MQNRIENCFSSLQDKNACALVTYITAGDPGPQATLPTMRTLVDAGADIIELGVPFSDPMADGPVIQRASERALQQGMSLNGVLDIVSDYRRENEIVPIVLMGYLNPIEAMGYERFSECAGDAGVDGVLIVDAPPEESVDINRALAANGLEQIFLIAPNSNTERIKNICDIARGFVYYVAVKGVTGTKAIDPVEVGRRLEEFRRVLSLPIGVGFGIKSAESAAAVAEVSDAAIVGSAIIEIVERYIADDELRLTEIHSFVGSLRDAMDRSRDESGDK